MQLTTNASTIQATPADEREVLKEAVPTSRHKDTKGIETFCSILRKLNRRTNIKNIDDNITVWQLNWVEVSWPDQEDSKMLTSDGRLFCNTFVRDFTGVGPQIKMNEESALTLAAVATREEFFELHAAGKHSFPPMASVKIVREIKTETGNSSDSHPVEYINFTIVEASDQPFGEKPTMSTLNLLPWTPFGEQDSSAILPCALHMVKTSSHYAFQVHVSLAGEPYEMTIPCQKIFCLIKSSSNSSTHPLGTAGFKVVTRNVQCCLAELDVHNPTSHQAKFVLSSICPMENVTSYKLDPPRKGVQYALVTITSMLEDAFVVDQVQHLSPEEAAAAKNSMWTLFRLACQNNKTDLKRKSTWTEEASPAKAKQCRTLGRAPTEADVTGLEL